MDAGTSTRLGGGWGLGRVMWVRVERQLLDTLHLGLANSLAWQKLLENKSGGLFQRWGGVAERINKGIRCVLLGAMSLVRWGPPAPG